MLTLTACSLPFVKNNEVSKNKVEKVADSSKQEKDVEVTEEAQLEKDLRVLLDSTFAGETKGFTTLYGDPFDRWTDYMYAKSAEKFVVDQEFEPQEDWTMKYLDAELTPEQVYTHFLKTRRKMIQKIGSDYKVKDISIDEDTATVTIETKVLNVQRIALIVRSIRSEIWGDDGELALGLTDDAELKKAVSLLNYYIIYANWSHKFMDLGEEFSAIPVSVSTHEYELRLDRTSRGDWLVSEEDYGNFISETLTTVDDYDDWEDANGVVENENPSAISSSSDI